MLQPTNPKTVHKPQAAYSHTVKVPPNAEWLTVSGQVGINRKGQLQSGPRRQCEQAYRNVLACLKANGMNKQHLVLTRIFLTDGRFLAEARAARAKVLGEATLCASTLVIVAGLASPDMVVEIEAVAAKA
jgi:2-iminobutanoate/2-iminopropanoate deaminase